MLTKSELKALIPHGMNKIIAEKAGVSSAAVSRYFSDETKSSFEIEKAAMEVALECRGELKAIEKKLTKLI